MPTTTQIKKLKLNFEQSENIKNELQKRWEQIENIPGIFSYKLNIKKEKYLPGNYRFFCQLNVERTTLRRKPQSITTIVPKFDNNKFNFNKINPEEKIIELEFINENKLATAKTADTTTTVTLLINNSPLTKYHSLICPEIENNLPQILTKDAINFSIKFLQILNDKNFRIAYNSAGALASVNHLHLHLIYLEKELYVDTVELQSIVENPNVFQIDQKHPMKALCFVIDPNETTNLVDKLFMLIENFLNLEIPHNLFFTLDRTNINDDDSTKNVKVKVFVFARETPFVLKDYSQLNIASCEFSGYITVGDEKLFNSLTEDLIVEAMVKENGNIFDRVIQIAQEIL